MIFLSKRFHAQVREYAELEKRFNKPFTEQITAIADAEYTRQSALVEDKAALARTIGDAVKTTVTRFPFEWNTSPF